MRRAALAALFVMFCAAGCRWHDVEQIDQVVWSEDDQAQAIAVLLYEERKSWHPLNGTTDKRDFRHQIYVQNADGTELRPLTQARPGQNGARMFYARGAGYVLVEVIETTEATHRQRYDLIETSGETQTLVAWTHPNRPCAGFEIMPSPDGRYVATVERHAPQGEGWECAGGDVEAVFYTAPAGNRHASHRWPVDAAMAEATWTPDGLLVVKAGSRAWALGPNSAPEPTEPPACLYPKTTSSNISNDGARIGPGESLESPVKVYGQGDTPPFGCQ